MSLTFRLLRRVGVPEPAGPSSGSDEIDDSFRSWRAACAELRAAEQSGRSPVIILALAAEVIRARNALTRAQISHGWVPSEAILRDLDRDEHLVQEADDRQP